MASNKKSFRDEANEVVKQFISIPIPVKPVDTESRPAAAEPADAQPVRQQSDRPMPAAYLGGEPKDRRVQLLFRQSVYDRAKSAANASGISLNEWIHRTLESALYEH